MAHDADIGMTVNANQPGTGMYPFQAASTPQRTGEVTEAMDRLGRARDALREAKAELIGRLDPVLRPGWNQVPCGPNDAKPAPMCGLATAITAVAESVEVAAADLHTLLHGIEL